MNKPCVEGSDSSMNASKNAHTWPPGRIRTGVVPKVTSTGSEMISASPAELPTSMFLTTPPERLSSDQIM